jgi:hypothetical protein
LTAPKARQPHRAPLGGTELESAAAGAIDVFAHDLAVVADATGAGRTGAGHGDDGEVQPWPANLSPELMSASPRAAGRAADNARRPVRRGKPGSRAVVLA